MIVSEPPPRDGIHRAGAAQEPLGFLQGTLIDAAGHGPAGALLDGVVGPGEPGDRIEDDHRVLSLLHPPAGAFERHFRYLDVALGRMVEARGDHFTEPARLHLGHFLGALVHQEDEEDRIRVVPATPSAMAWRTIVLPALAGATISAR